jgi:hypothetical protein
MPDDRVTPDNQVRRRANPDYPAALTCLLEYTLHGMNARQ